MQASEERNKIPLRRSRNAFFIMTDGYLPSLSRMQRMRAFFGKLIFNANLTFLGIEK